MVPGQGINFGICWAPDYHNSHTMLDYFSYCQHRNGVNILTGLLTHKKTDIVGKVRCVERKNARWKFCSSPCPLVIVFIRDLLPNRRGVGGSCVMVSGQGINLGVC